MRSACEPRGDHLRWTSESHRTLYLSTSGNRPFPTQKFNRVVISFFLFFFLSDHCFVVRFTPTEVGLLGGHRQKVLLHGWLVIKDVPVSFVNKFFF